MPAECPVCLELYDLSEKKPKVLRCSHSVCSSCLKSITHGDSVKCPTCRSLTNTQEVNTNYGLMDAIEDKCGASSKQVSTEKCLHCCQNICVCCSGTHSIELRTQVKKEMDNLRKLIGSMTISSMDHSVLEREAQREQETIRRIRNTAQTQRNEVDRAEREMVRKVQATSELNIQKVSEWMNNLESQLEECRSFVRGNRENVALIYMADSTETQMRQLKERARKLSSELLFMQSHLPAATEYKLTESSPPSSLLGEIVCCPRYVMDYSRVESKSVTGSQGVKQSQFQHRARVHCIGDEIVVTDDDNHMIKVYDDSLNLKFIFGEQGRGNHQFKYPSGVCSFDREVFISDSENHRIKVFNKTWKLLRIFGSEGHGKKDFNCPLDMAASLDGELFVCDSNNFSVKVVKTDGTFIRRIGSKGTDPGKFSEQPQRVAITTDRIVLVRITQGSNIYMFNQYGDYLRQLVNFIPGTTTSLSFRGLAVDKDNNIILADVNNHRLVVLNSEGGFICIVGEQGVQQGELDHPFDVEVRDNGDIIVYEIGNHRLQMFEVRCM